MGPTTIGLPGGAFYVMWAATTATTNDAGIPCQGKFYNERVRGRKIDLY